MLSKSKWWMAIGLAVATAPAYAQSYPKGNVTLIIPYQAGGPIDGIVNLHKQQLEKKWGVAVVMEHRPGGGTMPGSNAVARALPDGQTLLVNGNGAITGRIFLKEVPYEASELRTVVELMWASRVLLASTGVPAKTLKEFIEYAKANPKKLNYGNIPATSFELDYNVLLDKMGVQMTPVPYVSSAPGRTALLRNDIQFYMEPISSSIAQLAAENKVVMLAVTTPKRHPTMPSVPTAREAGLDYEFATSVGLWAPSRTPEPIIARIHQDVLAVMAMPEVKEGYQKIGWEPSTLSVKEYADKMAAEGKLYTDMAQRIGLKPQ